MAVKIYERPLYQGKPAPICNLETIDFSRLLSQEPAELEKLLKCCQTEGFFYLDLQGVDGRRMLEDEQSLLQVMKRFFDGDAEKKNELGLISQDHGYEPVGNHAGVIEDSKDGYEILKVSRDQISTSTPELPSILSKSDTSVFSSFIASSNIITKTMLSCLSTTLGLTGNDRFETFHRNSHRSNSTLAMFRYIPTTSISKTVGHQKHTDIGSLTLLFSQQWGLQVLPPNSTTWGFVPPKPGHAIINVGDSLRFSSGHKFHSCIHQVVPMDVPEDRYSIAYFLRPESEKKFKDSKGRWLTAGEWHDEKYDVFKQSHEQQAAENLILTGGMQ